MNEPDYLTVKEAADLLKVSRRTLDLWKQRPDFPAIKIGGTIRIEKSQLIDWFNSQK